jgi:hypothetical protein
MEMFFISDCGTKKKKEPFGNLRRHQDFIEDRL